MGRPGSGNTSSPDMSDRDLAELVAQVWERAGYPTRVEHYEGKTFVVAGTRPKSADLIWVVPAMENQQLAASWIGLYEAILEDLQVGQPYLVTTGGASDEAERAADRSEVVLVTRDNLATLLEQSGIGTDRLEISSSRASPSSPPAAEGTESETAGGTRTDVGGAGSVNPETEVGPGGRTDEPGGGPGADVDPSAKDDTVTGAFEGEGTTGAESGDNSPSSDSEDGAGPGAADDESAAGSASEEETDGRRTGSSGDSGTDHGSEDDGVAMVFDDESGGDSPASRGPGPVARVAVEATSIRFSMRVMVRRRVRLTVHLAEGSSRWGWGLSALAWWASSIERGYISFSGEAAASLRIMKRE